MMKTIKIDIVSDIACPWCIVGYKRLLQAINELGIEDKVELEWYPYQLNSHMGPEGEDLYEHIADKYGMSLEESNEVFDKMTDHGSEVGFSFDFFEGMRALNTFDAHVLLDCAKRSEKQTELKLGLFSAYFSDRKDVSDRTILLKEWEKIGLDVQQAMSVLDDSTVRQRVKAEEDELRKSGVSAVPTMFFNNGSKFIGAQPVDSYKEMLSELLDK